MNVELDLREASIAGLRAWLAGNAERASGADGRRGCLVVATAMELAAHDAQIQRRIGGYFKTMEAKLADALSRAQAAGELADGVDLATAARLLVSVAAGQRVIGKTVPDRATMQAPVDALFDQFTK